MIQRLVVKNRNRHIRPHTLLDSVNFQVFAAASPAGRSSGRPIFLCSFLTSLAVIAAACGRAEPSPDAASETAAASVDWMQTAKSIDIGDGWAVRGCPAQRPALCVEKDKTVIGQVRMEDVPSLGEEQTTSPDQVQAVLAVRIHSDYKALVMQRSQQCGQEYEVETLRPDPAVVAGQPGLRYGATGSMAGQVLEKTVGYRVFRDGIESLIEATAIRPGGCLIPEGPNFSIEQLSSFEAALDRLIADSRLPPATKFPEPSETVPAGNVDPRMAKGQRYGIGIEK
jgi:hypothetical protein